MTAAKSLPARPSLESLRKQAKQLARDVAVGDAAAIARARAQLPHGDVPLVKMTQRNAQLVIAREYGCAGWQDLTAEVSKRFGTGLEWAAAQARRAIHDHAVERLKQLWLNTRRYCPGTTTNIEADCWDSPRARTARRSARSENGGSPARRPRNC